ncbi:MAG: lipid II:glycine glycyltransferase FemX [Fusobacteriaceae bacterium]
MDLDIYFKEEYGKIYELNGEGKLGTFKIDGENGSVIYNFLKREIPIKLEGNSYYDIITPYGYGGPLFSDYSDEKALEKLKNQFGIEFSQYCTDENIVSEFVRFHPIIKNHEFVEAYMDVIYNRDTICIEIAGEDEGKIWESFTCKCRNNLHKAFRNNITVEIRQDIDIFYEIYLKTMERNCATSYYYFSKEFFRNTMELLGDGAKIFLASHEGKIVSGILVIHGGEYVHNHFSGTDPEYRDLGANNMLIFEAAKWGGRNGKRYFHLGGGCTDNSDSLYRYKSTFTKNDPYKFYTGQKIHNTEIYQKLVEEREKIEGIENRDYFPLYRG